MPDIYFNLHSQPSNSSYSLNFDQGMKNERQEERNPTAQLERAS
jgi:hypothetical protein